MSDRAVEHLVESTIKLLEPTFAELSRLTQFLNNKGKLKQMRVKEPPINFE